MPTLTLPPHPLPSASLPVGLLLPQQKSKSPSPPSVLSDSDYDDAGTQWYKDVITLSNKTGHFSESLGSIHLLESAPQKDAEYGIIEATEMKLRSLKDASAALRKVAASPEAKDWKDGHSGNNEEVLGFVTAVREVKNASYKRAGVRETGNGMWEVVREGDVPREQGVKKRRDSGLDVHTGSKWDVVGVEVRRVSVGEDGELVVGEVLGDEEVRGLL